jgi:hypothetical protein
MQDNKTTPMHTFQRFVLRLATRSAMERRPKVGERQREHPVVKRGFFCDDGSDPSATLCCVRRNRRKNVVSLGWSFLVAEVLVLLACCFLLPLALPPIFLLLNCATLVGVGASSTPVYVVD